MALDAEMAPGARMEAIATLPVFFKLGGKRAVLAGGTLPAAWKAELLSAAGASVDVYATAPCPALAALAATPPGGPVRLLQRAWSPDDLAGAAIAIGAIEEAGEAEAFRQAARRHGVPVNVIDNPPFCDFQFGTIVSRSPLIIGISTDGAAPVFGQALRTRIEALLPQGLKAWAEAARDWRPAVMAMGLDFRGRRRFWEAFTTIALAEADRVPTDGDQAACRDAAEQRDGTEHVAQLIFVGVGPGDPDRITLGAVRALQAADVVVHPHGMTPALVGLARREAIKLEVSASTSGAAQRAILAPHLGPGRRVVWMDKGDPSLCRVWARRAEDVIDSTKLTTVAGLGRCDACTPECPGWILG